MQQTLRSQSEFSRDGFTIFRSALSEHQVQQMIEAVESLRSDQSIPGMRNLLSRSSYVKNFATSGIAFEIAKEILGTEPLPVRGILFDKTPASNWYVTWHQDLSIPVTWRVDNEGYGPWSVKEGITHVQPPSAILEQMVSLRIHLDDCSQSNGAIKFIAGSHRAGILDAEALSKYKDDHIHVTCPAECGDIIAMRPLILHSSSAAESPGKRRVLHLEYAAARLPSGLNWAEA